MDTNIRNLELNDLHKATEVFCESFNSVGENWIPEIALNRLKQCFNPETCWVAEVNSEIIGVIICKKDYVLNREELYIDTIAVNPKHHKLGIGSKFLETAENYAKSQGFGAIWLTASTNIPSYDWYIKTGFKETSWKVLSKDLK
jgi:ribosomal protein S18 acetylase RimI-like enzyme